MKVNAQNVGAGGGSDTEAAVGGATSQTIESCLTGVATPSFPGHVGIGAFIPGLHAFNRFVSVLLVDPRLLSAV